MGNQETNDDRGVTSRGRRSWRSRIRDTGTILMVLAFGGFITAFAFLLKELPTIAGVSAVGGAACLVLGGICFWVGHERRAVRG